MGNYISKFWQITISEWKWMPWKLQDQEKVNKDSNKKLYGMLSSQSNHTYVNDTYIKKSEQ